MRVRKKILWFAFLLVFPKVVLAQDAKTTAATPISLEEAITRAVGIWPGVEAAQYDTGIIEGKLAEAKSAYVLPEFKLRVLGGVVPDIPAGAGPPTFPDVDTGISDIGPFVQAKVEALQPIFTFGKLSNVKEAARRGVTVKEHQVQLVKNEITYRVKEVYYGLVYLMSLNDFIHEIDERLQSARRRVEELLAKNSPDVTDIDLMRLNVFAADTERRTVELERGIDLAGQTLGILVFGPNGQKAIPSEKGLVFHEIAFQDLGYYFARAKSHRPQILQLDQAVAIAEHLQKAALADFFPMFFLGGFYQYSLAPDRAQIENPYIRDEFNTNSGGGALGFEQKLSFHLTNSRYRQAKAAYLKAVADQRQALIGIELEIRKAHSEATSKQEAVKIARKGFQAGRSWVTATTLNFSVGLVPVKELLEAFIAYSKVKVDYFDTMHNFYKATAMLSQVIGEEVNGVHFQTSN